MRIQRLSSEWTVERKPIVFANNSRTLQKERYLKDLRGAPLPFIGRQRQLAVFTHIFQEITAGHPRVLLVHGEAGVGKTRLLKEVLAGVSRSEMSTCYGRCYEDSALTSPLLIESLCSGLLRVAEQGGPALADEAEILRRLLPEGKTAFPSVPSIITRPEQERFTIFCALARTVIRIAQYRPLFLAVDDLQWADQFSLDLLQHLMFAGADTAEQEPVPLFLLGSYRSMESQERLTRALACFQREEICRTLELSGLDEEEVSELIRGMGIERPSRQLVAMVQTTTQGNPLFIQEIILHLLAQNGFQKRGGFYVSRVPSGDLQLPVQITNAIAARARRLSVECQRLLAFAAVLGERFSFKLLELVSGKDAAEVLDLLDEGLLQRVLISRESDFQFAHPLIRSVFYHELSIPRRQHLHLRIAQALESSYGRAVDVPILEIAHHLVYSGAETEAEKLAVYARRAGDIAFSRSAWGEATQYYEAALSAVTSEQNSTLQERAELHHLAGRAHYRNMDVGPALDHYERAVACFQLTDDVRGLSQALAEKVQISFTLASVPYGTLIDLNPLENAVGNLGETERGLQGYLWATIAKAYWVARLPERTEPAARRALELGRQTKNNTLCAEAHIAVALSQSQSLQLREELESWRNSLKCAESAGDVWRQGLALQRIPMPLLGLGRLDEAEAVAQHACQAIRETHDWGGYSMALAMLASIDVVKGNFVAAEKHAHETLLMASRSRYPWGAALALPSLACARALRGESTEAEEALALLVEPDRIFAEPGPAMQMLTWMYRQLLRTRSGEIDDSWELGAKELLKIGGNDIHALAGYCAIVELSEASTRPAIAEAAYDALALAVQREIVFSSGWIFLLPRVLGVAATLNQWWDKAEVHFHSALETAKQLTARPALGRTYLDYARMLSARAGSGDLSLATDFARDALDLCEQLGLNPFVQQARQLLDSLSTPRKTARAPLEAAQDPQEKQEEDGFSCQRIGTPRESELESEQEENANVFRREGDVWALTYQNETCRLKDAKGLRYLAFLLRYPGKEIYAGELLSRVGKGRAACIISESAMLNGQELLEYGLRVDEPNNREWVLDGQATAAYKHRLTELREELAEAQHFNDAVRAEKLQEEIDFFVKELTSTMGFGGRSRKNASTAERARLSVTKAIKTALRHIRESHLSLGQHLNATIRTGTFCSYFPDPTRPVFWTW